MRPVVLMLVTFLIALLGSGCAPKEPCVDQFVNIPQKCVIKVEEMPVIESKTFKEGEELGQSKWVYTNYLLIKEYAMKLRKDIKQCQ